MKNSSKKINQPKKCKEERHDESPCNRPVYDEKHCIFHSEEIEKKRKDFDRAFSKEFDRQKKEDEYYDFKGFIFPDSISFAAIKFDKDVHFDGAQFTGNETCFEMTQFEGNETSFSGAEFKGNKTSFIMAKFAGKIISFENTQFKGNETFFSEGIFKGEVTSFILAQFTAEDTSFDGTQFKAETTYFYSAKLISKTTSFYGAKFTGNVSFSITILKNVWYLFESLVKERKWLFLKTKRYLIKDWRFYLQEETANRHPLIKRLVNDAWYLEEFKLRHPIAYFFWKILANCGRSMLLWAAWSLGIALMFGFLFMRIDPTAFDLRHIPTKFSFFYYSIVTFTTLGFGDITPKTLTAEILVTIEVILGYIMLGGLISILANKLARRS